MRSAPPFVSSTLSYRPLQRPYPPAGACRRGGRLAIAGAVAHWGKPLLDLPCGIRATARFEAVAIDPQGAARCRSQSMTNGRAQDRDASVALSPAFDLIS